MHTGGGFNGKLLQQAEDTKGVAQHRGGLHQEQGLSAFGQAAAQGQQELDAAAVEFGHAAGVDPGVAQQRGQGQQQLSVMAEHSVAARAAAMLGLAGRGWRVDTLRAAVAKARTGEAAAQVAAIAHAVHGAIGVTEEFDLQMFTRRLHEWRMQYGGESYWSRRLGRALLEASSPPLQFVQERLSAAAARRD